MMRTEHCGVDTLKVWKRVIEREDLGGADKGKVTTNTSDMDCGDFNDGLTEGKTLESP